MPKGKTVGYKVRGHVAKAIHCLDSLVNQLMAADITAKGGRIDGKGFIAPVGVDMKDPTTEGHPVLNQYLPFILEICGALKESLNNMRVKM